MVSRARTIRSIGLVSLVLGLGIAPVHAQEVRSDQQILIQLERDWDEAFLRRDVAFIERVLADEFVATYSNGTRADKAK